jgi:hypothetical protein
MDYSNDIYSKKVQFDKNISSFIVVWLQSRTLFSVCWGLKIRENFVNYFKHAFIIGFTPYVFVITGKLASTAFR